MTIVDRSFHYSSSSPSQPFLIEGVLGSKNLFSESCLERPKPRGRHLSRPRPPFWGPLVTILDFSGGAALQAVSERPLRR